MKRVTAFKEFIKKETWKKYLTVLVTLLVLVSLLEVFLFNYRHFESFSFDRIAKDEYDLSIRGAVRGEEVGDYIFLETDQGGATLRFDFGGKEIRNIRVAAETGTGVSLHPEIYFTDKGNEKLLKANDKGDVWVTRMEVERSQYRRVHFAGKVGALEIFFAANPYETAYIDVSFNVVVPYSFSFLRTGALTLLLFLLFCLRPTSFLWRFKLLGAKRKWCKIAVCAVLLTAQIFVFRGLTTSNPFWMTGSRDYESQYHRVAEALAAGQVYLKDSPPQWLSEMKNPYDTWKRAQLEEQTGETVLWDHAYFNGRYYSYFGVLPALTYYLPYHLATGSHAPTYFGVFLCLTVFCVFSMLLLYEIIRRWFQETPFLLYLMLAVLFINTAGTVYIAHRPDFYSFPIVMSLALTVGGLYFWIAAKRNGKYRVLFLLLGSFFIAFNALSRPQFLIAGLLALPLFGEDIFKERLFFSKRGVLRAVALILPFVFAAAVAMWYNSARFGSPFDFGATYNLTSNDMTARGFVMQRSWLGFFTYLFQPVGLDAVFPYLLPTVTATNYLGVTIKEATYGGFFATSLLSLFSFGVFRAKRLWQDKKTVKHLAVSAFLFAFLVILADTQMAGILIRYIPDFSYLLLLTSVFAVLGMFEKADLKTVKILRTVMVAVLVLSLGYQFFISYTDIGFPPWYFAPVRSAETSVLFEFLI